MKKLMVIFAVGFVICAFVALQVAVAAEQTKPMSSQSSPASATKSKSDTGEKAQMNTGRVSKIIGQTIVDNQNQRVGKVEELLMDNDRCIGYVILSHGGLLGIGEKYVPIPWNQFAAEGKVRTDSSGNIVVNISKAQLEKAPNFDKSNWAEAGKSDFRQKVESYYPRAGLEKSQGAHMERGSMTPARAGYEKPATSGEQPSTQGTPGMQREKSKMETPSATGSSSDQKRAGEKSKESSK